MNISLDYDDTYTRDPEMWNIFIANAHLSDHYVYLVTMRYPHEGKPIEDAVRGLVDDIIYTGRKAKKPFMYALGIPVHVWIDDSPNWILQDAAS